MPEQDKWLEDAKDNFKESLSTGQGELAKAIIMDVIDAGYSEDAKEMYEELNDSATGRKMHIGEDNII